jgi:hypothetical protein
LGELLRAQVYVHEGGACLRDYLIYGGVLQYTPEEFHTYDVIELAHPYEVLHLLDALVAVVDVHEVLLNAAVQGEG